LVARRFPVLERGHQSPPNFVFKPVRTSTFEALASDSPSAPKVLSIVAPIGYGKTVMMSELYAHRQQAGAQCHWLGLDSRNADITRLLLSLHALFFAGHETDIHPTQVLWAGDEPIDQGVDGLVALLASVTDSSTLFIDNLNSCTDERLADLLDALVFRTPANIRLVWSSNSDPPVDLGRAKIEGLIREVGFDDLSFGAKETGLLLGADLERKIQSSGVETVLRQTEGWPAAIRMAQIVLSSARHPLIALEAFSGSDEDVSAFLKRQVLQGFPPEVRDFLFCLAQLRVFSVELCFHVTGNTQTRSYIDSLLHRNVFIIPLDRNRRWYRLHGLFREYLLSEAEGSLDPERKRQVLKRAADWCARNSEWRDAIDYALASGEAAAAGRILDRTATIFLRDRGDSQQYIGWAEQLDTEGVPLGWLAHFWYVWALVFRQRYEGGRIQHERLAERLRTFKESEGKPAPPPDLSQRLAHLRVCIDLFTDRLEDSELGALRWLAAGPGGDPYNFASIHCIRSCCLASAFRIAEARKDLQVAEPIMLEVSGAYSTGWVCMLNAILSLYEGHLVEAHDELLVGMSRVAAELGEDSGLYGNMSLVAANCLVEMGRDGEARERLSLGLRTAHKHGLIGIIACGFDAAVKLWSGAEGDPFSPARLRVLAHSYPPRLGLTLSCYAVRRLLRLGRLEDALLEANRVGLWLDDHVVAVSAADATPVAHLQDLLSATAIDLQIAMRHFGQAEALIETLVSTAQSGGRQARVVELLLAQVAIATLKGDLRLARRDLVTVIGIAARDGIVRPFLDQADTVLLLVDDTKISSWPFVTSLEREFFAAACRSLPISNRFLHELAAFVTANVEVPPAPTRREAELLVLMNVGLSNEQIADRTEASVNTIKWHLSNLYRKLGVSNRSAALARARALNLLPK
jgi:LuxR family maltose regulon positive regulatory protein